MGMHIYGELLINWDVIFSTIYRLGYEHRMNIVNMSAVKKIQNNITDLEYAGVVVFAYEELQQRLD